MIASKVIVAFTNNLLVEATKRNIAVSPLKLQKLLYFCGGIYLVRSKLLFEKGAEFEAWSLGPVMREVYFEFRVFGNQRITNKAIFEDGMAYQLSKGSIKAHQVIQTCLDKYGHFSASHLVALTHHNDGAWDRAYTKGKGTIIDEKDIINDFREYA